MVHSLELTVAALAELEDAVRWYAADSPGVGMNFRAAVQRTMDRIGYHSESYAPVQGSIRRALVHRFPYGVFFQVRESSILVIGVMHERRDPRRWQERVESL